MAAKPIVWDEKAAQTGLQRWHDMCRREGIDPVQQDEDLLRAVFGASWYGTRYLFYSAAGADQMCADVSTDPTDPGILAGYLDAGTDSALDEQAADQPLTADHAMEQSMMKLRRGHSRSLLALIGWDVTGRLTQEPLEYWLSCLAHMTLTRALDILIKAHPALNELMVLGMGRLAGYEMNYGSDLDLIFLHKGRGGVPDDLRAGINALLQQCQMTTPAGRLYDIDTRLRPYGGAGALITSLESFRDYHARRRETWEHQMLCRCRPLRDPDRALTPVLEELAGVLYSGWQPADKLAKDIYELRLRVEKELGRPAGRVEIKRGYGGIMDIDFLTHYLQLAHGRHEQGTSATAASSSAGAAGLCFAGTRQCLRVAMACGLCVTEKGERLLKNYDFLKALEGRLRAFDMKADSRFPDDPARFGAAARGLLWPDIPADEAGAALLNHFHRMRDQVRTDFLSIISPSS